MAAFLQVGYFIIIVTVLVALITGRREPIFWGLLFFIGATVIGYAGIMTSKKSTNLIGRDIKIPRGK